MIEVIAVYFSPHASNASLDSWKERIQKVLFRSQIIYRKPLNLKELNRLLEIDIEAKVHSIIVIGGDGSVNTLAQKLAYTDIGLLVVPGGTANDFASELGHKSKIDKVLHSVRTNSFKYMDLINVNGQFMVTNGGIGIGSFVASEINTLRKSHPLFKKLMKLLGPNVYEIFLVKEFLMPKIKEFEFEVSSQAIRKKFNSAFVLINNQSKLAGKFSIAPKTKNDDGSFNLTILTAKNRFHLIKCIYQILVDRFVPDQKSTFSLETSEVFIRCSDKKVNLKYFGDGEIFENIEDINANEWKISIEPKALKIFTKLESSYQNYSADEIHIL